MTTSRNQFGFTNFARPWCALCPSGKPAASRRLPAVLIRRNLGFVRRTARRGRSQRECYRRPTGPGRGNPLVCAIREAAVEVRLHPDGPRLHMPRSVGGLRVQEIFHSLGIYRLAGSHLSGNVERVERLTSSVGRAVEFRSTDEEIKAQNYMVDANRSKSRTRRRQTRLMSSKGF